MTFAVTSPVFVENKVVNQFFERLRVLDSPVGACIAICNAVRYNISVGKKWNANCSETVVAIDERLGKVRLLDLWRKTWRCHFEVTLTNNLIYLLQKFTYTHARPCTADRTLTPGDQEDANISYVQISITSYWHSPEWWFFAWFA